MAARDEFSSEEERVGMVKRHTPARLVSSSSGSEHESGATATAGLRSSVRLRDKASRRFRLPSRDEVLDQVSPSNTTYTQSSIRKLKPRKLVNNYLKERSTYVTERSYEVDSDNSFLSDFITDDDYDSSNSSDSDVDQEENGSNGKSSNVRRVLSNVENHLSSDNEDNDSGKHVWTGHATRRSTMTKTKRMRPRVKITSSDSDSSNEFNQKQRSKRKRRKICSVSSESATGDNDKDNMKQQTSETSVSWKATCSESISATRPRSVRVLSLAMSHENERHKVLGNLLHKRQSARLNPKERIARKQAERMEEDEETAPVEEACRLWKDDSEDEDEDDKEFVVPDYDDDDDANSDAVVQFMDMFDSLASKTDRPDGHNYQAGELEGRENGGSTNHGWHRIVANEESDDTEEDQNASKKSVDKCPVAVIAAVLEGDQQALEHIVREDPTCINVVFKEKTALHFAAAHGNHNLVKFLLTVGANPTIYDSDHLPAVAYAADGHPECLELILKHTDKCLTSIFNHMKRSKQGFSLLHFAVIGTRQSIDCESRAKCLELLCNHDNKTFELMLDHMDGQGFTPLVRAVNTAQHKCVQALLERGASPYQFKTSEGGNLLHCAVESASSHMIEEQQDVSLCLREILPYMKCDTDEVDRNGFTPLMYACESGNADCAAVLLDGGASVSISDSHGTSSLHLAAMIGSAHCVQLLLDFGHQVDCLDRHGWPPLLYANFQAHESCVLALMKPKPDQVFVLGNLLNKTENEVDKRKTFKVVKNVLISLANHDAYYTVFNDFIWAHSEMLDEHGQGLLQDTWRGILDFKNKRRWFRKKLSQIRQSGNCLKLVVDRKDVLGSAIGQLGHILGHALREKSLHVTFKDEPGICTGPKKEFYTCFCKDVVDPERGLFRVTDDSQYSPFPNAYFAKCREIEKRHSSQATSQAIVASCPGQGTVECSDEELVTAVTELELQGLGQIDANKQPSTQANNLPCPLRSQNGRNDQTYVVNQSLHSKLKQMRFIGRMVGFAVCEEILLDFPLSVPFAKQVLGITLSHPSDLSSFDNELHKNAVVWVLENSVCELELPFSVDVINPWNQKPVTVMLCGEQDRLLSDENKHMYVKLVSEFMLQTSIKDEVAEFTRGLREVIPRDLLSFFTADEFSLLINGVYSIDVEDWRRNTRYSGYQANDDVIKWFWDVVSRLKEEEKALLLKFSTGSPCVPVGGFAALQGMEGTCKFTIVKIGGTNKIPLASTCFNMLKLTEYDEEKELREKLLIAIRHGAEGFSFS